MKLFLFMLCIAPGTLMTAEKTPSLDIPTVELEGLEPAVARRLSLAMEDLRQQAATATDERELGALYGQLGQLFHAYAFDDQARWSYRRASVFDPDEFRWVYLPALIEAEEGVQAIAITALQAALRIAPNYLAARLRLAALLRDDGDLQAARRVLTTQDVSTTDDPAVWSALGEQALAEENYSVAITHFQNALTALPEANRLHYLLGTAYRAMGDRKAARTHFKAAGPVGVKPSDPLLDEVEILAKGEVLYVMHGHRAFNAGDFDAAVAAFTQAIELQPDSVRARVNLGAALVEAGQPQQAVTHFNEALRLQPDNKTALYNLATLIRTAGDVAASGELYRRLLALDATDTEAHYRLAEALRAAGDDDQALKHLQIARSDLDLVKPSTLLAVDILLERNQADVALAQLESATALVPADANLTLTLANLKSAAADRSLRNGDQALALARKVHTHQPSARSAESIAMAYAELQQCEQAATWLHTAHDLLPDPTSTDADRLLRLQQRVQGPEGCRP